MRKILMVIAMVFVVACATPQQRQEATQGVDIETGQSREVVMEALVQMLTNEGYSIDTINEKYGIINCKPYKILTGDLMKKVGEPGAGFIATNKHMIHIIEFSSTVSKEGVLRMKSIASSEESENIMTTMLDPANAKKSTSMDIHRTTKLHQYYAKKIKDILNIE